MQEEMGEAVLCHHCPLAPHFWSVMKHLEAAAGRQAACRTCGPKVIQLCPWAWQITQLWSCIMLGSVHLCRKTDKEAMLVRAVCTGS